ncbi:MAG: response regulator transcription factor, partial [Fervidobacterium sp.]
MAKKTIMIIDDQPEILELVSFTLQKEGYEVVPAEDAEKALQELKEKDIDLFIVDIMLPNMDGFEFVRTIRGSEKHKLTPVIFLSAKGEEFDKVLGLELGADDYIVKPFSVRELLARIRAVFRRMQLGTVVKEEKPKKIIAKDLEIDIDKYEVKVEGKKISLTPLEFDLLRFLAENEGK